MKYDLMPVDTGAKKFVYPAAVCCALITFLVYLPALRNGFVNWDDPMYVTENVTIRSLNLSFFKWAFTSFDAANWHPLTWISYAVDYAVWGLEPFGYHLTNVLMHCLNTFLVVVLAGKLGAARPVITAPSSNLAEGGAGSLIAPSATGLLFGLHPLHVESVAWVSERKDVLCAAFYLLGLLSYLRYAATAEIRSQKGLGAVFADRNYLLALGMFVLALMSKPMAVTLPLVLLILDWYPLGRAEKSGWWKLLAEKIPFLLLAFASGIVTILAQRSTMISVSALPVGARFVVAAKSLATYLAKMIYPDRLIPYYPLDPRHVSLFSFEYALPVLMTAAIAGCAYYFGKAKIVRAAWCYYFVTLLPVLGIVQVGEQTMADRYTYITSIGPFLLAAFGAAGIWNRTKGAKTLKGIAKKALAASALAGVLFLSTATVTQMQIWKDSLALWNHDIKIDPTSGRAFHCRGNAYQALGLFDEAGRDYSEAVRLTPASPELHYNFGRLKMKLGFYAEAVKEYTEAIRLSRAPDSDYYFGRGLAYKRLGDTQKAITDFYRAEAISNAGKGR